MHRRRAERCLQNTQTLYDEGRARGSSRAARTFVHGSALFMSVLISYYCFALHRRATRRDGSPRLSRAAMPEEHSFPPRPRHERSPWSVHEKSTVVLER